MNGAHRKRRAGPGQQRGQLILVGNVWMLRYREPPNSKGRRRRVSVRVGTVNELSSREQVREAADRIMVRIAPPRVVPGTAMLWPDCCRRFRELYLVNLGRGSQRGYLSIIANHLEPAFRDLHAHDISAAVIQQWLSAQQRAGIPRNTILSRFRVLRRIVKRTAADGIAAAWPGPRTLELPRDTSVRRELRTKAFTTDEMDALIRAARPLWLKALLALLRYTGIRVGEALGLTWPNVRITARAPTIHVQQSASDGVIGPTKTSSSLRDIDIPPALLNVLMAWQAVCPPSPAQVLFPGPKGRPRSSAGVRSRHLIPLLAELRITRRGFHGFRHGAGYTLLDAGANLADVGALLGHSDLRQTAQYAQSRRDGRRDAVLAAALLRKPPSNGGQRR